MSELNRPDRRWRPDPAAIRAALRRSRWPRLLLVIAATIALASQVDRALDRAAAARNAWAPTVEVWVATTDLEAGTLLTAADVVARVLPATAVPRDPRVDDPVGRRLRDDMAAGEILRDGRLGDAGIGVLAARLPAGSGGLQLFVPAPHLTPGDLVDLYALLSGDRVASRAEVIAVDDGLVTVAVATSELPAVVRSFTTGDVVPVVVG